MSQGATVMSFAASSGVQLQSLSLRNLQIVGGSSALLDFSESTALHVSGNALNAVVVSCDTKKSATCTAAFNAGGAHGIAIDGYALGVAVIGANVQMGWSKLDGASFARYAFRDLLLRGSTVNADFHGSRFTAVPSEAFAETTVHASLQAFLNLSSCGLRLLPPRLFLGAGFGAQSSMTIDLSANQLSTFGGSFENAACGQVTLLLDNNQLRVLDPAAFLDVGPCLSHLSLLGNPIQTLQQHWSQPLVNLVALSMPTAGNASHCRVTVGPTATSSLVACDCAPGYYGDGAFCDSVPCGSDALTTTHGSFQCSSDENGQVPSGAGCQLRCDKGFTAAPGLAMSVACLGGVWGQLPHSTLLPSCSDCAAGYSRTSGGGSCEKPANYKTLAVALPLGLLLAVVLVVAARRLLYLHRMRKSFHFFISYRVAVSQPLAVAVRQALISAAEACGVEAVEVFLDKFSLETGQDWKMQFMAGLVRSCVVVPLVAEESIAPWLDSLDYPEADNFLLELGTAVRMQKQGRLCVFPLLIGSSRKNDDGRVTFAEFDFNTHGGHLFANAKVRRVMNDLFALQGQNLSKYNDWDWQRNGLPPALLQALVTFFREQAWCGEESLQLQQHWKALERAEYETSARKAADSGDLEAPLLTGSSV